MRTEDPPPYAVAPAVDPLVKAVDDWIEMERKARAWDALREACREKNLQAMAHLMTQTLDAATPKA